MGDPQGRDIGPWALAQHRNLLPPGSFLAISHITTDGIPDPLQPKLAELKHRYDTSSSPVIWRSQHDINALLGDFTPLPPGMCWTPLWHPEESSPGAPDTTFNAPNESVIWAGVGRKA